MDLLGIGVDESDAVDESVEAMQGFDQRRYVVHLALHERTA
jgi:hypothetical protein